MTDVKRQVILTIDDEVVIRKSFRAFLEDYDFKVLEAENGQVGLEVFERENPDLVLVDLRMPEVDGLAVLARVKENSPDTPIIVVSGTGAIGDAIEALHLGATDYLLKPIEDLTVLLHAVEKALEHTRLIKENRSYQEHLEEKVARRTEELNQANVELLQTNEQLRISEEKFRTLAETSPLAIMMLQDDKWIYANRAGETITGYNREELLSMNYWDFVRHDFLDSIKNKVEEVKKGKMQLSRLELLIETKNDEEKWIDVAGGLTELNDRPTGILSFIDITEKKKAEKDLQTINRELEQRVEERTLELKRTNIELLEAKETADAATLAKSNFLANMSHEIRTPMNGVIVAADLALSEKVSPKVKHFIKIIQTSGYSLMGVINDILDFSKVEAGKLDLEARPFLLNEVLDDAVAMFVNKAGDKEIELLLDIDPVIPNALVGDQLRIRQILTNLLSNAFKFTKKSGIITVGIKEAGTQPTRQDQVRLNFYVKDTGVGLTKDQQSRLFQPFTQADTSTTRQYGGTGLGLSICKRLTDMMDGKIWVESEPEKGSTFQFTLLLKKQPLEKEPTLVVPQDLQNLTILVVDDNGESRRLLSRQLQHLGFQAESASSARQAVDVLRTDHERERPFDLILMDWKMPEMDGIEAVRRIRRDLNLNTPIVLMSVFGLETEPINAQEEKIDGLLSKPVGFWSLFYTVLDVFGQAEPYGRKTGINIPAYTSLYKNHVRGMRILVAEDNPTNQDIALAILENVGISVQIANNGREAVTAVQDTPFDAVLMDIQMPEMDGYEATRIIRNDPNLASLPIIAMTAHAMKGDQEKCLQAGMNDYISKPINQDKLFQILSKNVKYESLPISFREIRTRTQRNLTDVSHALPANLPGIAVKNALNELDINDDTYKRILLVFYNNSKNVMQSIQEAFDKKEWHSLWDLAHNIKGSAANIGADKVETTAYALEIGGRNASNIPDGDVPGQKMVDALKKDLDQVFESIQSLSEQLENHSEKASEEITDPTRLSYAVKHLARALELADPEETNIHLKTVRKHLDSTDIQAIEDKIDNYDFDDALEILKAVAENLDVELD
ncbi:MAG: response regulator [Proteobacteria bacterium]|nr:response regulator [Pseudomonadota bacterium]